VTRVSMSDMNKKANSIINQAVRTGEPVIITQHGRPIAEIRPTVESDERMNALQYLQSIKPAIVSTPLDEVLETGRSRGVR